MKKFFAMIMCGVMTAVGMYGCGGEIIGPTGDDSKYVLNVSSYEGGVGQEWLKKAEARFESEHANDEFPGGKVGIDVVVDYNKNDIAETIDLSRYDIVIDEIRNIFDISAQGKLLDISDVVKDDTDGASIESRLTEIQKESLTAIKGKYYVVPHFEYFGGLAYDINTFEDYDLYFAKGGGFVSKTNRVKSVGPDGIENTYDDGLPRIYEELFALIDRMIGKNVIPFIWSGNYKFYVNVFLNGLLGNYCGVDELEAMINLDSKGKDVRVVTGFDNNNKPIIENKVITAENGYYTRQLAGKYYALSVLEKIMNTPKDNPKTYYNRSMLSGFTNIEAQRVFVNAYARQGMDGEKPIAFLVEGNYWYNEASDAKVFADLKKYGITESERKIGWLPLPNAVTTEEWVAGKKNTLLCSGSAYMMINNNISNDEQKVKVAKEFIKFLNTEKSLQEFTETTGITKGLKYELTDAQYDALGTFGKSVWDIKKKSNVVYPLSKEKIFIENYGALGVNTNESFWESNIKGSYSTLPVDKMYNGVSAKDYFEGLKISPSEWNTKYGKYFN